MTEPMLAATLDDLSQVRYPVACTPKVDGYRCMIQNGVCIGGRKGKAITNRHIQKILGQMTFLNHCDGELIIPGLPFHKAGGHLRSHDWEGNFKFLIFDNFGVPEMRYTERVAPFSYIVESFAVLGCLYPTIISTEKGLIEYEKECIEQGYEGVILRDPSGRYKFGRSTINEFGMVKWKRFIDDEATCIGFEELKLNLNEEERDAYGRIDRPTNAANKVPAGTLGALVASWKGRTFNVGTGFTQFQRDEIWRNRAHYQGLTFTFKYQPEGTDLLPRQPVFKDWRIE